MEKLLPEDAPERQRLLGRRVTRNYAVCPNCQHYMPLHHPDAGTWVAHPNEKCREWTP